MEQAARMKNCRFFHTKAIIHHRRTCIDKPDIHTIRIFSHSSFKLFCRRGAERSKLLPHGLHILSVLLEFFFDEFRYLMCNSLGKCLVLTLGHNSDKGLSTRRTYKESACVAKLCRTVL